MFLAALLTAGLIDAERADARRGHLHEIARRLGTAPDTLSPLQRRLLWVLQAWPEETAMLTLELAWYMPGMPGALPPGQERRSGYTHPGGYRQLLRDLANLSEARGIPLAPRSYFEQEIRAERVYMSSTVPLPRTNPGERILPFLAKEVHRILRTLPSVRIRDPARALRARGGGKIVEVTIEDLRAMFVRGGPRSLDRDRLRRNLGIDLDPDRGVLVGQHGFTFAQVVTDEEVLVALHLGQINEGAPSLIDWVQSGEAGDIMALDYAEAIQASKRWHARLLRTAEGTPAKEKGQVLATLSDGWTVQNLATSSSIREEGHLLGHCVGGDGYRKGVEDGRIGIWSVRNAQNVPVYTLEVSFDTEGGPRIVQWKGEGNRLPGLSRGTTSRLGYWSTLTDLRSRIAELPARSRPKAEEGHRVLAVIHALREPRTTPHKRDARWWSRPLYVFCRDLDPLRAIGFDYPPDIP